MKRFLYLLTACFLLLTTACTSSQQKEVDLVVLYTTDTHGAIFPDDFGQRSQTSLVQVSSYVQKTRANAADRMLLLDTGDMLQGGALPYYYNYVDTTSLHIIPAVYNFMQYDAVGVGNHDIETGEAIYNHRLKQQWQMPWLSANLIDTRTGEPMFTPYTVIEKKGVKVAILGLTTPNIPAWLPHDIWPHLCFEDMTQSARKWVKIIKENEHPDVLIGLFHSGIDYTYGGMKYNTLCNENATIPVAESVPGFDLILAGHDHRATQKTVVNSAGDTVLILNAGDHARFIGRADIHLSFTHDSAHPEKTITTSLINTVHLPQDTAFLAAFHDQREALRDYVTRPIGILSQTLVGAPALVGPSELMTLVHEVQHEATHADISIAAVLAPRATIPAGQLTMLDLFALYPYENKLHTLKMTGAEIDHLLEYGFGQQFATMQTAKDNMLLYKRDSHNAILYNEKGVCYATNIFNFTAATGIRYTLDLKKPAGDKVTIHSLSDGRPWQPDLYYTVAINSYQASGNGSFLSLSMDWTSDTIAARTLSTTPYDIRTYLAQYLTQHNVYVPHVNNDWDIVPHDWWERGKYRELIRYSAQNE